MAAAEPFTPEPFTPEPFAPQPFLGGAGDGGSGGFPNGPVTIDMGGDPLAASLGTPDPFSAFGLDDLPPPPPAFDEDPLPSPEPMAPVSPPAGAGAGRDRDETPTGLDEADQADDQGWPSIPPVRRSPRKRAIPPPPPVDGDPAEVGIRPRNPTRIPAAGTGEAKAILDRIAALRSRRD